MKLFFKYWLPVLLWAVFIFLVSSLPGKDIPGLFWGQDILFHIFEYAVLALLLSRALKNSRFFSLSNKPMRLSLVIISCLVYALSDELHQYFVPGRISCISDLIIDGMGVVLGSTIYRW